MPSSCGPHGAETKLKASKILSFRRIKLFHKKLEQQQPVDRFLDFLLPKNLPNNLSLNSLSLSLSLAGQDRADKKLERLHSSACLSIAGVSSSRLSKIEKKAFRLKINPKLWLRCVVGCGLHSVRNNTC